MKTSAFFLLPLIQSALAIGFYAIDANCNDAEKAGIEKAMGAAIDRAKAARDRLSNPDDLTDRAFKVVFGESWSQKGLQDQINFAKNFMGAIADIGREPVTTPQAFLWRPSGGRNWDNIEIWCSADDKRFVAIEGATDERGEQLWEDAIAIMNRPQWENKGVELRRHGHRGEVYQPPDGLDMDAEAVTRRYENKIDPNRPATSDNLRSGGRAASIDVFKTWRDQWSAKGWPILTREFVEKARLPEELSKIEEEWKKQTDKEFRQVEALMMPEHVMLHELFHTKHGGRKQDKGTLDHPDCYGFSCVTAIKQTQNADSMAYLGLLLQLLDWGYMVNADGVIIKHAV
ncbi:unnamed protein product [Parascedosporium putredinis]|uniref:Uncharacterized protein n=1 Tax=Parascedosporium putredinis TaxID=1442378 RepID=A0A9P1H1T0_9PEZI|nr:unnamed protein product [Parascedosporium putredinis]CAI7993028.1 unnamed protein product [Parascedosporium putredinis]